MKLYTADLCDAHPDEITTVRPGFRSYGGVRSFGGRIRTVRVSDDNSLVKSTLMEPGEGNVLVVDGGASTRCALLGGNLGALAARNGWSGLLINGCVRDTHELCDCDVGVLALGTCPRKSEKRGEGEKDVAVEFAGAVFRPDEFVYCDLDGIITAERDLATP